MSAPAVNNKPPLPPVTPQETSRFVCLNAYGKALNDCKAIALITCIAAPLIAAVALIIDLFLSCCSSAQAAKPVVDEDDKIDWNKVNLFEGCAEETKARLEAIDAQAKMDEENRAKAAQAFYNKLREEIIHGPKAKTSLQSPFDIHTNPDSLLRVTRPPRIAGLLMPGKSETVLVFGPALPLNAKAEEVVAAAPKAKAEVVAAAAPEVKAEVVAAAAPEAKAEVVAAAAPEVKAEVVVAAAPEVKAAAAPAAAPIRNGRSLSPSALKKKIIHREKRLKNDPNADRNKIEAELADLRAKLAAKIAQ